MGPVLRRLLQQRLAQKSSTHGSTKGSVSIVGPTSAFVNSFRLIFCRFVDVQATLDTWSARKSASRSTRCRMVNNDDFFPKTPTELAFDLSFACCCTFGGPVFRRCLRPPPKPMFQVPFGDFCVFAISMVAPGLVAKCAPLHPMMNETTMCRHSTLALTSEKVSCFAAMCW